MFIKLTNLSVISFDDKDYECMPYNGVIYIANQDINSFHIVDCDVDNDVFFVVFNAKIDDKVCSVVIETMSLERCQQYIEDILNQYREINDMENIKTHIFADGKISKMGQS